MSWAGHYGDSKHASAFVDCPGVTAPEGRYDLCNAPAGIVEGFTLQSTSGPVRHVRTRRVLGHRLTFQAELLQFRHRQPYKLMLSAAMIPLTGNDCTRPGGPDVPLADQQSGIALRDALGGCETGRRSVSRAIGQA